MRALSLGCALLLAAATACAPVPRGTRINAFVDTPEVLLSDADPAAPDTELEVRLEMEGDLVPVTFDYYGVSYTAGGDRPVPELMREGTQTYPAEPLRLGPAPGSAGPTATVRVPAFNGRVRHYVAEHPEATFSAKVTFIGKWPSGMQAFVSTWVPFRAAARPGGAPSATPSPAPTGTPTPGPNDIPTPGPNDTPKPGPNDTPKPGPNDTPTPGPSLAP